MHKTDAGLTKPQKKIQQDLGKATDIVIEDALAKVNVSREQYDSFDKRLERAKRDIEKGNENQDALINTYEIMQEVYGAMTELKKIYESDPMLDKASKIRIDKLSKIKDKFKEEIIDNIQNLENIKSKMTPVTDVQKIQTKSAFNKIRTDIE